MFARGLLLLAAALAPALAGDVLQPGAPELDRPTVTALGIKLPISGDDNYNAGSIFDLRPATTYEIELHAIDPDGPVDRVFTITATTRDVPGDPAEPNAIAVSDAAAFASIAGKLKAGDVVTLAGRHLLRPLPH